MLAISNKSINKVGFLTRWFPGTLTNWDSIFDFVSRVKNNPEIVSMSNPKNYRRWQVLKGLQTLDKRPDILIILHAKDHSVAINEANQINIPSIGIVDSNANGVNLTYPIIGNDDSLEAQFLYCRIFINVLKHSSKDNKTVSHNDFYSLLSAKVFSLVFKCTFLLLKKIL